MPIDSNAVIGTPVGHDAVNVGKGALPGQAGSKPGGRPGGIGPGIDGIVDLIGKDRLSSLRQSAAQGQLPEQY